MSFYSELKRRGLVQVAITSLVVACTGDISPAGGCLAGPAEL
jgi:hypothetical protein